MLDKVGQTFQATQVAGEIPIHHRYTVGVAGQRFFQAMRDDRQLLAAGCSGCPAKLLPPKMYCERCFCDTAEEWTALEGPGRVRSFTVLHCDLDGQPLPAPQLVALVEWPGVRGGLVHRLGGVTPAEVELGMAVLPVWAAERNGSLDDIEHFRPAR